MPSGASERPAAPSFTSLPPGAATVADRYVLLRELGAGGMGTVYLARDLQTGETVALKQLTRIDAKSVLRFKREFRSVANIQHPNLVRLYDLEREPNGMWFLTMEYVPGTDLISHLCPDKAPEPDWRSDTPRVLDCFRQLAQGVRALHAAGMLHRDLKPSNVLVAGGRVLVLDFGLVRGIDESDARLTEDGMVSGTPAYMAPEQAMAKPLSEATDWYAFGAMLYEVFAGELPFEGNPLQILRQKVDAEPRSLAELEPDVPRELTDLCDALLRRDPAERPSGVQVLERLGVAPAPMPRTGDADTTSMTDLQPSAAHFVGRAESLQRLALALGEVERGQTVAVHVQGRSGAGKSALIEHFLSSVEKAGPSLAASDVLVLRSRCYEREAMPFKALDSIMDALTLDLARRDDVAVGHLLPSDVQALAQLFPALERVQAVKKLLGLQRLQTQARTHRQRAEAALRELFARLAQSQRLIVWVDDLHWGDLDSVAILRAWLEQSSDAPFLLVLSYRSDEVDTSPALRALLEPGDAGRSRANEHRIEVGPLQQTDLRALCSERLGARANGRPSLIEHIVREANGDPFLASQLASLALAKIERGETQLESLSIQDLISQTQALLSPEAGSALAVLAVAGRPMSPKLALRVAGVRHGGRAVLHTLRSLNLVRMRDSDTERLVEVYHDRIREYVSRGLSPNVLTAIHQGLLRAMERTGLSDPDWLHALALGAGDRALALQYGLAAAERALSTLAFERAAELYTRCLELCEPNAPERGPLWRELGNVLGCAGRGARAAEALLEAAELAVSASEKLELKRMAASHFVRVGQFDRGDALFEEVMAATGIQAPRTDGKVVAAVVWERVRLGMRGLSFKQRPLEEISPATLARIDLLEDLRIATNSHDALRASLFTARSLRLALECGEPTRVCRALCTAALVAASEGTESAAAESQALLARAAKLLEEFGGARERLVLTISQAGACFHEGRFADVLAPAYEFERTLREQATESADAYFYKFAALAFRIGALSQLDWRRFRAEFLEARKEAHATENVHALLMFSLNEFLSDEIGGEPEASVARLEVQRGQLPPGRFSLLHILHLTAVLSAAAATGKHDWGFECLTTYWDAFKRSPLRRSAVVRAMVHAARARLLLCSYVRGNKDPALLRDVVDDGRKILGGTTYMAAQQQRLTARVAFLRGDRDRALALFRDGVERLKAHGLEPDSLRDSCAVGLLTGGPEGERLFDEAVDALEQRMGCANVRRYLRAYLPELVGSVGA